jgi:osmotically-inducible protein OsmY
MSRKYVVLVPSVLGLTLAFGTWVAAGPPKDVPATLLAQQSKGAGETISEKVGDVVEGIKRGARATSESVQEQYQKARAAVHDMGVQSRVYSRLHWDKDLNDSKIEVEFKDGTLAMHGTVKSLVAKVKASVLARDTVGVERVDDHLTIDSAAPVVEPRPAAKTKS